MAFLQCEFHSDVLGRACSMNVLIPQKAATQIGMDSAGASGRAEYPVLYLLHGLSDNHSIWMRRTSIERYAAAYGLVVVMPSGERGFYTDMAAGYRYWTMLSEELPQIVRNLFPVSAKREETFAAGLSMGGYGALKIALKNPDVFSGAISLSGVLNIAKSAAEVTWDRDFTLIWGEDYKSALPGSEDDLFYLTDNIKGEKPRIFISCGDCDFMLGQNRDFHEHIKDAGFDFRYEEHPGNHNWMYWAEHIAEGLDFILGR